MKITVIQNKIHQTVDETIIGIDNLMKETQVGNTDFLVFSEMFTTPYESKHFLTHKQSLDGQVITYLSDLAKRYHSYVIGGSVPYEDQGKIYNTTFVFDRKGYIIGRYDKIHLFEIRYPDGKTFRESDVLESGDKILTFDTEFGIMGVEICFDIRYPELTTILQRKGAVVVFVPAAFNTYTGPMHWQTTFRARAIDNQIFMIGCSPSADSYGEYKVYGHSLVVDPLGNVLKELDGDAGIFNLDIDLDLVDDVRESLPIVKNRRDLKDL